MELGLSLGEAPKPFSFMDKASSSSRSSNRFCMALGVGPTATATATATEDDDDRETERRSASVSAAATEEDRDERPPVQLDLLPLVPVPRHPPLLTFPWPADPGNSEACSSSHMANTRGFDVNRLPSADDHEDAAAAAVDSPNSAVSSFQMDFSIYCGSGSKRDGEAAANEAEAERTSSRASDEDENGMTRKKLRLSKEQSAFLEESFKEHNTLNPKQKLALAKQLNLRPRQVEVWFQNRRARTKLKQTEVDCEYLKRCCETLTEENRRLQKELQELRALKTSHPFYMQLPATTLTMCPSCERVAAATTTTAAAAATDASSAKPAGFSGLAKPRFYPFSQPHQPPSAAS